MRPRDAFAARFRTLIPFYLAVHRTDLAMEMVTLAQSIERANDYEVRRESAYLEDLHTRAVMILATQGTA